jgi:hypothetical protein
LRNFNDLSGPWVGLSVQYGIRISESMTLTIRDGRIDGSGVDKDGDFELLGFYQARTEKVMITRRYTRTTEPSQEYAGVPYDYEGHWDGGMVSGRWHARSVPQMNGPFEMWPDREEDREELRLEFVELPVAIHASGKGRPTVL